MTKSQAIEFEEPPPPRSAPRRDPTEVNMAQALVANPDRWGVVGTYTTHYEAQLTERRVRRGSPGSAWAAGFAVAVRKVDDQQWKVYARYAGRPEDDAEGVSA